LTEYFDTALNRANVVLYKIQHLIGLRLDVDVLPSKFISDFNDSMLHLTKNKAMLAADNDTLRLCSWWQFNMTPLTLSGKPLSRFLRFYPATPQ